MPKCLESNREQFEAAYAAHYQRVWGVACMPQDVAAMRVGDEYGNRPYLNGWWAGWKAATEASNP